MRDGLARWQEDESLRTDPLALLGGLVLVAALALGGGVTGLVVGIVLAFGGLVVSVPAFVAGGHVLVLSVLPAEAGSVVVPLEAGFALVALSSLDGLGARLVGGAAFVSAGGLVVYAYSVGGLGVGAAVVVLALGLALYALHRLGLVTLGLVEEGAS